MQIIIICSNKVRNYPSSYVFCEQVVAICIYIIYELIISHRHVVLAFADMRKHFEWGKFMSHVSYTL